MYIVPDDDVQFQNFIHNVIALRQQHHLTRRRMAEILHITPQQLRQLEQGQISSRLYVDIFFHLHGHFGISFRDLFGTRI